MKACIIFSSCTGNTRTLAEALADASSLPCHPVRMAPDPAGFDVLALGFWVRRGLPDGRSLRYMAQVRGKKIFFFGTMGACAHSPHAVRCLASTRGLLEKGGNTVLDGFLCQGRVNPKVVAVTQRKGTHPPSPERLARLAAAQSHPDETDCRAVCLRWRSCLLRLAGPDSAAAPHVFPPATPLPDSLASSLRRG